LSPEIITRDIKCIRCGKCVKACPQQAIVVIDNTRIIQWEKCNYCMKCAEVCPSGAIEAVGKHMTVSEVLDIVERDASYYRRTGGGMTLSGGEPLVQWQVALQLLKEAKKRGFSAEVASDVFALIEPFAGYAFNKAHSVSYALIAYQTAYLKANYPAEYITAFLSANAGQPERVASAVAECRRLGITVLSPDINRSQANFSIEQGNNLSSSIRCSSHWVSSISCPATDCNLQTVSCTELSLPLRFPAAP
jgi:ferredoxin